MALLCNAIDGVCCGLRPCCQCLNPCIKTCGCGNRKVFYNFDGSITVEPLVSYFKPRNAIVKGNLFKGMKLDKDVLKKGLSPVEQIAAVVQFASKKHYSVRAVGTGSSWSKITTVRDILIDTTNLDEILDAKPQNSVSSIYHIEVQTGMILKDFFREIDRRYGMALPASPVYIKQTVGGAVSTSTHGTGQDNQSLSNCIVELHMVIANGIQVKIRLPRKEGDVDEDFDSVECKIETADYGDPPIEICSTDIFRAAAVGLGCLGVIYSVTFECIAVYNVKETRRKIEIKWPSKKQTKKFKIPSEVKEHVLDPSKYVSILVNPYPGESDVKPGKTVLKSALFLGERTDERSSDCCKCQYCFTECQCYQCCTYNPDCRSTVCQTDCVVNCAQMFSYCCPSWVPTFADCGLTQMARFLDHPDVDRWYKIFGHVQKNALFRQASYFVPLCDLETVLADIVKMMTEYLDYRIYSFIPLLVRMVKADDLYLSPANRRRCDGTVVDYYANINVSFQSGAYGIDEFQKKVEEHIFTLYKGRPNWGIIFRQSAYYVPLCNLDAALADIVKLMTEYIDYRVYSLAPLHVRMVKADDLFLSPANRRRCDGTVVDNYAVIDVTFLRGTYGIDEFHKKVEEHLFNRYKARPHWGKNLFLNLDTIGQLYPDLDKWRRVYLLFNSDGTFDNEFTRMVGFENFRGTKGCRTNVHLCHSSCPDHAAVHLATISGQAQAQQRGLSAAGIALQETTVTTVEHGDHAHRKVASSKIIYQRGNTSNVITSQPKRSRDLPRNKRRGSGNHHHRGHDDDDDHHHHYRR